MTIFLYMVLLYTVCLINPLLYMVRRNFLHYRALDSKYLITMEVKWKRKRRENILIREIIKYANQKSEEVLQL